MNVFFLNENPFVAVKMLTNKHVVKMTLETGQILSTVHRVVKGDKADSILYKATHINHPCSKWARGSRENYRWLYNYFLAIALEYTKRFGKPHKTWVALNQALCDIPEELPSIGFTEPPQAMPEMYRGDNTKEAYIRYYMGEKLNSREELNNFLASMGVSNA